jgi:hypothetical protein
MGDLRLALRLRQAQRGLVHRVDGDVGVGATSGALSHWAGVDHQRAEDVAGHGGQAGRDDQHVWRHLGHLPVAGVTQVQLRGGTQ